MTAYTKKQDIALLILRLVIAAIFLYAGYAKLGLWSGSPEGMSAGMLALMKALSVIEPIGALALLFGFMTKQASAVLAAVMIGAIYVMQFTMGVGFMTPAGPGWNFPLVILAGCVVLMTFGPGTWSLNSKEPMKHT